MIPAPILARFQAVPVELIDLCRPHSWAELTTPPGAGLRPIRDVLVHMISAEKHWLDHVIAGRPRTRFRPETFGDLDAILAVWRPQRDGTVAFVTALSAEDRRSRRSFPWDATQSASVEEIVWHVVTHEQCHRGQLFTRLALLGRRDLPDYDLLR